VSGEQWWWWWWWCMAAGHMIWVVQITPQNVIEFQITLGREMEF